MDNVEEVTLKAGSAAALNADGNGLDNRMRGNEFENVLKGLAGDDMLSGGDGKDTMIGGDGDDMIFVDQADDIVVELVNGGTADWVIASRSFDLIAGVEVELLSTIDDRDTAKINLYGNEVAQTITGNAGANILSDGGKGGADILIGLNGDDTYRVYNKGTKIIE
jgi:Ca2+-binding RTX toxin-like protein